MQPTTVLFGGCVVTPEGVVAADLEIDGEQIKQVAIPGGFSPDPNRARIDVTARSS